MLFKIKSKKEIFEDQEKKENKVDDILKGKVDEPDLSLDKTEAERKPVHKIMKRLNFEELRSKVMQLNAFCIGTKDKVEGQILYLTEQLKQKFVLVRIIRKIDNLSGGESFRYFFFNEKPPLGSITWKTIEAEFYLYKLTTREKTYQLFSTEKLDLGEYDIWGTEIEALDYIDLGNYAKIGKKIPYLFVHSAFPKANQIQDHKEFFERFEKYNLDEKKLIDWIYTSPQGWVYEYPKSFCYIQIANLLGCPDDFNTFHLPLLMISETGTGKTTATELIFNKMNEIQEYTDMTSSTLKGLIPSFKNQSDLKPGLLLESRRYVPVDEFLAGMSNLHPEEKDKVMENIKNLLDYKERAHRSGHGNIKGKMRADHIALSNPKGYGNNILQLSRHFFPENLTRYLIWYIPNSQIDFIEQKQIEKLKRGDFSFISQEDFLEGIDYLKTFNCVYDIEKVREIFDIGKNFLKSKPDEFKNLKSMYKSRYLIHACRLLDSLTKLRCWVENDKSFKSKAQDYALLRQLWIEMLECWGIDFLILEHNKI